MKDGMLGLTLVLFAILWQMCTTNMNQISIIIGLAGVICTAIGTSKKM